MAKKIEISPDKPGAATKDTPTHTGSGRAKDSQPARPARSRPGWKRRENRPLVILSVVLIVIMAMRLALGFRPARSQTQASAQAVAQATHSAVGGAAPIAGIPSGSEAATEALQTYFSLLQTGRYAEADAYFGGDYGVLQANNPGLPAEDHAALFQAACTDNGFQCLAVKNIVKTEEISSDQFVFSVEFRKPDGSLLVRETRDDAGIHDAFAFPFTVSRVADHWLVQDLPVLLP